MRILGTWLVGLPLPMGSAAWAHPGPLAHEHPPLDPASSLGTWTISLAAVALLIVCLHRVRAVLRRRPTQCDEVRSCR